MAELLTHVLVPYLLLTPLRWRLDWPSNRWIVVAMAGATIPDLVKIRLVLDPRVIESLTGFEVSYAPISTLGGLLVIAGAIALFFGDLRRRAFLALCLGGLSALVLDGVRVFASGHANPWLYPFLWWRPPTPSLYVTSDVRVTILAITLAGVTLLWDRYRSRLLPDVARLFDDA